MTVVRAGEPHEPADVVARPWHCAAEASPFARRRGFLAKEGQVVAEPAEDGRSVLLNVGLGPAGSATAAVFRQAAAAAIRAVGPARTVRLDLALTEGTAMPAAERVRAVTERARLALYRYDTFRSARPLPPPVEVRVTGGAPEALLEALAGAEGTCLARDLVNSPPGVLTPASFAHRIEAAAAEAGLSCEVYEGPASHSCGWRVLRP
ncbi:M17 family peptidase N-terminal domain-containing protein [Streptomyces sp. NPDC020898]|uniref:M17 family peptidase N-terminal domain-containing protein n=1 Tax=Streptomyces sp. NPDC020898 TaxID=3365101 RepID=UPI003796CAC8